MMMDNLIRFLAAVEKIGDSLEAIAKVQAQIAEAHRVIGNSASYFAEADGEKVDQDIYIKKQAIKEMEEAKAAAAQAEIPAPAKEAPRKARVERRAAVRDAAKAAGLAQKDIEKAVGAPYADWTADHCTMVEGMTAEQLAINEAKAQEEAAAIEEPTLTEAPAEEVQPVSEADLDEVVEPEVLAAEIKADAPSNDDIRKAVVAWANVHGKEAAKRMIKEIGGADRLADVPDRAHWVALYHAMSAKEAA